MKRGLRLVVLIAAASLALTAIPAAADNDSRPTETYLALGDSYAFGFNPNVSLAGRFNPANFPGYTNEVASALGLNLTNAACPGETSGSMILTTAADNGCKAWRSNFPLHTSYGGAQLRFAVNYLRTHHHTDLITVQIGGNDVLILQTLCAGNTSCIIAGLPAVETQMAANLNTIYSALRRQGHYHGAIVTVPYFAFNYQDPANVAIASSLDGVVAAVGTAYRAHVADVFGAFKTASANTVPLPGIPCFAGLQYPNPTPPPPCDIHPSLAGHALIAQTVLAAIPAQPREDD